MADASQLQTPLLILVGPTGTGKTAVGIELCQRLNGEIISADSMQIYRGCDIGTAKASPPELARARHHLVNIREPYQEYSAAQWAGDAVLAIADIRARAKQPIIVGGTGFYLQALLHPNRLADVPPNPELRAELEALAAGQGAGVLHERLAQLDAAAAARLHPNDVKRVIRAIEVASAPDARAGDDSVCGRNPLTSPAPVAYDSINFGLDMPRDQLYQRLEQRIEVMLQQGFMDELRWLTQLPGSRSTLALQSLGYRQMLPVLAEPERFDECVALWKRDTRRYAKRQMTWFRHQLPVQWITLDESTPPARVAASIERAWREDVEKKK